MKWKLLPQECKGTYIFSGKSFITRQLAEDLPPEEVIAIAELIQERVQAGGGADYLQVLEDDKGNRIFAIDSLNAEMKASGEYGAKHDYWTLMYASEY